MRSHCQRHLNQISSTTLTVPFRFSMDAEVASRYLKTAADTLRGEVYSELSVDDKDVIM